MATKSLTRDAILGMDDLQIEEVSVPEWGGIVRIRMMNAEEQEQFGISATDGKGELDPSVSHNLLARLVAFTAVDDDGKRLFNETADVEALGKKSAAALQRVAQAALKLNAMTEEELENIAKN